MKKKSFLGILAIILLINVAYATVIFFLNNKNADVYRVLSGDGPSYYQAAEGLVKYHKLCYSTSPNDYCIVRLPGFPILLLPGVLINNMPLWALFINWVSLLVAVIFLYKIGLLLGFSYRITIFTCLYFGLSLQTLRYTSSILTEMTFTAVLILSIYYYLKSLQKFSTPNFLIASFLLIYSIFIRPIALYLFPVMCIIFFIRIYIERKKMIKRISVVFLMLLIYWGAIQGWTYRNKTVTGYNGFTAVSSINWYYCFSPKILMEKENITREEAYYKLGIESFERFHCLYPELINKTDAEIYNFYDQKGKEFVFENFDIFIKLLTKGTLKTFVDPCYPHRLLGYYSFAENWNNIKGANIITKILNSPYQIKLYLFLTMLYMIYFSFFIFNYIRILFVEKNWEIHLFIGLVIAYFVVLGGFHGLARFRYPILGIYLLYILGGGVYIYDYINQLISKKSKKTIT